MMCDNDDMLQRTGERLVEIARRILKLANDVIEENVSPGEVSAEVYAEAEHLREISEELKD